MISRETILELYARNLDYARRLTADLPADKWAYQPAPKMNHAAWVIGHLARTADLTGALLLDEQTSVPTSWMDLFGPTSTPSPDASIYPDGRTLIDALEAGHARTVAAVNKADLSILSQPPKLERLKPRFATLSIFVGHAMTTHEMVHLGQLSAWRRAQGLPAV
jgi:hypothetical protein